MEKREFYCIGLECKWTCNKKGHASSAIILFILCPLIVFAFIALKHGQLKSNQ